MLRWLKQVGSNPLVQVAGLTLSIATLVDFQGSLSVLVALYPAVKAVAPIAALMGAILFGLLLVTSLYRWCRSRRPAARFHSYHDRFTDCRDRIVTCIQWGGNTDFLPLVSDVLEVRQILAELEITPPAVTTNNRGVFLQQWANFLGVLVPLAEHSRLREARQFANRVTK